MKSAIELISCYEISRRGFLFKVANIADTPETQKLALLPILGISHFQCLTHMCC